MTTVKIPKTIHYCWFGGNPLPELAIKCIDSWKKFCPDYQIVEWNESNFDVNACDYIREAYEAKKWAFVSDYARYVILYEQGGVYLDTDVELIKPIGDIIEQGNYMGCENYSENEILVNPGLGFASVAGNEFLAEMIAEYRESHFINKDGCLNLYNVVNRTTDALKQHGLENKKEIQDIAGFLVYPAEYFCPIDMRDGRLKLTEKSYSIHHYSASWFSKKDKCYSAFLRFINRTFGQKFFDYLQKTFGKNKQE